MNLFAYASMHTVLAGDSISNKVVRFKELRKLKLQSFGPKGFGRFDSTNLSASARNKTSNEHDDRY
eukprot:757200-Hanusia_phi.AAC.1